MGSSPLTRGKRVPAERDGEAEGLIPAHAGKTALAGDRSEAGRAHPRSRGENARIMPPRFINEAHPRSRGENGDETARNALAPGSSPLTRGKLARPATESGSRGLIPAHAGKTPDML